MGILAVVLTLVTMVIIYEVSTWSYREYNYWTKDKVSDTLKKDQKEIEEKCKRKLEEKDKKYSRALEKIDEKCKRELEENEEDNFQKKRAGMQMNKKLIDLVRKKFKVGEESN